MATVNVTPAEQKALLALAREAIHAYLTHGPGPRLDSGVAAERLGAFVSLHVDGDLRGCIGYIQTDAPLGEVVARMAVCAAADDPRFPSVTLDELSRAQIEISVLGPIEPVRALDEIVVGRHGLIASQGYYKGLLLPQVATEHGWDRDTFLCHTCLKAGLRSDAWRAGAQIAKFEAVVFSEVPSPESEVPSRES